MVKNNVHVKFQHNCGQMIKNYDHDYCHDDAQKFKNYDLIMMLLFKHLPKHPKFSWSWTRFLPLTMTMAKIQTFISHILDAVY